MLLAFTNLMDRLDVVYAASAANAPKAFDERINFWNRECGMRADLLRIGCTRFALGRMQLATTTARGGDARGRAMRKTRRSSYPQ
jgi:hypothetical protein